MSVSRGSGGLLVREGGTGGLWVFLPLLFHSPPSQEGAGRERRLRRLTGPQGLDPSLGGLSRTLQTSGLLSRLPLHPLLGPEPQAEESQLERRGAGDHSDGHASSPSCLSVCLSSSLCLWRSPGPAGCYVSTVTSGAASGWWAAVRSPTG